MPCDTLWAPASRLYPKTYPKPYPKMTQKRISAAVFTKVKNGFAIFFGGENEKKHYIKKLGSFLGLVLGTVLGTVFMASRCAFLGHFWVRFWVVFG